MDWLNRVGMLLEFLSFFFAAPEIVTEVRDDEGEWLRALEQVLERMLRVSPPWIAVALFLGRTGPLVVFGPLLLLKVRELSWILWIPVAIAVLITLGFVYLDWILANLFAEVFKRVLVDRLLRILANDKHIRRRWLKIGVGMFMLGFVLQFIATF